jgi:c-di-GMP-binding flagellar brake protein YcgR
MCEKLYVSNDVLTGMVSQIIITITVADVSGSSRSDMSFTRTRRDTRYDFPATIEYVMGSQSDDEVLHKGVTINLSSTGLCMYIFDPLPKGQRVTIKTALPIDFRTAAICWTRKEDDNFYRSGLKFI